MPAKFDPSVNPLYSPIMGTIPLPGDEAPPATPQMPPYHTPVHGSHLGLYPYPATAPSPALSAASISSSSSGHSHHSQPYHVAGYPYQHQHGHPYQQLSPLTSPAVNGIATPPLHPSFPPKHAHTHPQYRPTHAHTHSRTYSAHAPLPHQAHAGYIYPRPRT